MIKCSLEINPIRPRPPFQSVARPEVSSEAGMSKIKVNINQLK